MLKALSKRPATLRVSTLVVATLAAACFPIGRNEPLPPSGIRREIFNEVNNHRARHHLPSLSWNDRLGGLAPEWSEHMAATESLSHRDLNATLHGPGFEGFRGLAENLLVGPCGMSAAKAAETWMASQGHRRNILGDYNVAGVGAVCSHGRLWVTQNYGRV